MENIRALHFTGLHKQVAVIAKKSVARSPLWRHRCGGGVGGERGERRVEGGGEEEGGGGRRRGYLSPLLCQAFPLTSFLQQVAGCGRCFTIAHA